MKPYLCPVCQGCGNVPGGFYTATVGHVEGWISAHAIETCKSCNGLGIIYEGGLIKCETKEKTEELYQFSDKDTITILKDIRCYLITLIDELRTLNRKNV